MRLSKDSTVRRAVLSLLVAVVVLIPLSVVINRLSRNTEGFNIAEVFSGSHAASAASTTADGGDFTNLVSEEFLEVADSSLTLEEGDRDAKKSTPVNQTGARRDESPGLDSRLPSSSTTSPVTVSSPPTSDNDEEVESSPSSKSPGGEVLQNPWDRSEARRQRVFQPASLPHYAFVKFSAYRQSLRTFFVMGITSYVARAYDRGRIVHSCEWHPSNASLAMARSNRFVETQASHIYWKTDENSGTYNPTTINCTFREDVGEDRMGGVLVLRISTGYDRWARNLPVVAMEELPGEVDVVLTPPEKLPYKYAFCGAPMHGTVRTDWLLQWMTYHHYLAEGKAHFFFYNLGGLKQADKPTFQRFLDAGKLSITDILDPNLVADYPTWYHHQVLLINDCLHRSRFMAERVFFIDYDEFVQIPAPDTLSEFMARHEKQPWISLGSMYANTKNCRNSQPGVSEAPLERMLWRRPTPECREKPPIKPHSDPWLCIGPLGRRKFVANPRETFAAGVHWVTIPEKGLNLVAKEAHVLHYRSAPIPKVNLCAKNVTLSDNKDSEERAILKDGWIRDESTSKIYSQAKLFPV